MKKNSILDRLFRREIQEESQTVKHNIFFKPTVLPPHSHLAVCKSKEYLLGMALQEGSETYDPGSSRSLWGRLLGADTMEDIGDLRAARDTVYKAAETHGLWRAVIGASAETVQQYGLNQRENWKTLVGDKINVIADELGIPQEDFRWVASWHGEGLGGPHIHVMWWDNSDTVQPQIIPAEKFKAMEERVRSSFNEGLTNLKASQLTRQEQTPEPELEDDEELEM